MQYECYNIDTLNGIYKTAREEESHACNFAPMLMYDIASSKYLATLSRSTPLTYFGGIPCNAGLEGGWHVSEGKGQREREMLGV